MTHYCCSGLILYTKDGKVLLEDRGRINKHGEHWSFFGGSLKEGEAKEQALVREIKEELSFELKDFTYIGRYDYKPKEDLVVTYYMYKTKVPSSQKLIPHAKASMKLFTYKQALKLRMLPIDKEIITDYYNSLV